MEIFYGICGEGLGHTGRSLSIINELVKNGHSVTVFTYGEAYDFFIKNGFQKVHKIPGFHFHIKNGRIDFLRSFVGLLKEIAKMPKVLHSMAQMHKPDLIITDLEPLTCRLAKKLHIPCITIDNQHRFLTRQKMLPFTLKCVCFLMGLYVKALIPKSTINIISSFHPGESYGKFIHVGPIVRNEITSAKISNQGHVLVYVKPYVAEKLLPILKSMKEHSFIVYGSGVTADTENVKYAQINNDQFIIDLASARAVLCTAGNQIIGEANYLRKAVFAIPIPKQYEQSVNAVYVKKCGFGDACSLSEFTADKLRSFLDKEWKLNEPMNAIEKITRILSFYLQNDAIR